MMRASSIAHRLVNEARRAQGEHGVSRYTHCMRRTVDAFEQFGINIHADFFLSRPARHRRALRLDCYNRRCRRPRVRCTRNECGNRCLALRKRRSFRNRHVNPYLLTVLSIPCRYPFDIDMMSFH
ncbi:hypothetical protein DO73_4499 [Burkholderia pseudomallei]|nr:hypothetical protein DO73_4499 [Burkholderia pseudomallei]